MTEQISVSLKTAEFEKLGLGKEILEVVAELGFEKPSEIQARTIPLVVKGRDVIGHSATGSGKTLAFAAAIIEKAEIGKGVQALVMTPTRELCIQVAESLRLFSKIKKLKVQEIYGGVGMEAQVRGVGKAEIIVGTPGRLLDHLRHRTLNLDKVKVLVLDEADRMVDMGFLHDVEEIVKRNPVDRQTLLFSATSSPDIDYISSKYMQEPETVEVESYVDPSKLNQHYYDVNSGEKFSLLLHLLKGEKSKLVMVFCNTQRASDSVARNLTKNKVDAVAIHGGLTQARRTMIMKKFHAGKVMVLVCTDVAARGLHIENVSHVYNYDIPKSGSEYIHRIGRTARAGESGEAVSLVTNRDYKEFSDVQNELEGVSIERRELPKFEGVYADFGGRGDSRGGGFGSRDSRGGSGRGGGYNNGRRGGSYQKKFGGGDRGSGGGFSRGGFGNKGGRSFGGRSGSSYGKREGGSSGGGYGRGGFGGRKFGSGGCNKSGSGNQRSGGRNFGGGERKSFGNRGGSSYGKREGGSSGGGSYGKKEGERDGGRKFRDKRRGDSRDRRSRR